jgi:hypothetical protein
MVFLKHKNSEYAETICTFRQCMMNLKGQFFDKESVRGLLCILVYEKNSLLFKFFVILKKLLSAYAERRKNY